MFFFSISGNLTYVASILFKSLRRRYIIANLPWLAFVPLSLSFSFTFSTLLTLSSLPRSMLAVVQLLPSFSTSPFSASLRTSLVNKGGSFCLRFVSSSSSSPWPSFLYFQLGLWLTLFFFLAFRFYRRKLDAPSSTGRTNRLGVKNTRSSDKTSRRKPEMAR